MSLFQMFGRENTKKDQRQEDDIDKLSEGEEMLLRKRGFLKKKINQELQFIETNSRKNRRVSLQALRRKKWYEKQLRFIDCGVKAMRSAYEQIDIVNKVNDLIKDITEDQDRTEDMSDKLSTSLTFGGEFEEDELLAELERLEKNLDDGLLEKARWEERGQVDAAAGNFTCFNKSCRTDDKAEEAEVEDELEHLRCWVNAL